MMPRPVRGIETALQLRCSFLLQAFIQILHGKCNIFVVVLFINQEQAVLQKIKIIFVWKDTVAGLNRRRLYNFFLQ